MRSRSIASMACGVVFASCLVAGCGDDANSGKDTDIAKLTLPKGVSDEPVRKPYKSRAKHSAPPIALNLPTK
jgi:hypothetical protein